MTNTKTEKISGPIGDWFSSGLGWHIHYEIVDLAIEHGLTLSDSQSDDLAKYRDNEGLGFEDSEDIGDTMFETGGLLDMAQWYLNSLTIDGYLFRWRENAFGLYPITKENDDA